MKRLLHCYIRCSMFAVGSMYWFIIHRLFIISTHKSMHASINLLLISRLGYWYNLSCMLGWLSVRFTSWGSVRSCHIQVWHVKTVKRSSINYRLRVCWAWPIKHSISMWQNITVPWQCFFKIELPNLSPRGRLICQCRMMVAVMWLKMDSPCWSQKQSDEKHSK